MRSGLLVLLAATLALLWWILSAPPVSDPADQAGGAGVQRLQEVSPATPSVQAPGSPTPGSQASTSQTPNAAEDASFERGDLADLPITQRKGFIPVQVWGLSSPLPSAEVSTLSFAKLGEVMMDTDLWPFIITADIVLKHGVAQKSGDNGVVQIPMSNSPCYVASQVGKITAMATLLPDTWNGEAVRLWVRPQPKLEVQVRYANGLPVHGVPVYLGSEDAGNNARLLGEDRRQRTSANGSAQFVMTESAQRILGVAGDVSAETAALAAALGYTESDFDTLLPSELVVVVPTYAGERQALALPTPLDFEKPVVLTLPDAGALHIQIRRADGTQLSGSAELFAVSPSGRSKSQPYTFLVPEDGAKLSSVAVDRRYQLRVEVDGIGGEIVRVIDGPLSDGEIVLAEFVPDDLARVTAKLLDEDGNVLANSSVKIVFVSGRRRLDTQAPTNAEGQLVAILPREFADQPITAVEILDVYVEPNTKPNHIAKRTRRSTRIALQGVLSSLEDLGTLTLK